MRIRSVRIASGLILLLVLSLFAAACGGDDEATGKAASVDVLEASALAYLAAINTLLMRAQAREQQGDAPHEDTP